MAEFIAEWTSTPDEEIQETTIPGKETSRDWIMYFDGAFSLQGAGAGVLLVAPTGERLKYVIETPTMRLYLPRVGARLRGITAW